MLKYRAKQKGNDFLNGVHMDTIQRAIEKKRHISKYEELNSQTWAEFEKAADQKKIFLYGVGACADYYLENNCQVRLEGVVDNDIRKQDFPLSVFSEEACKTVNGELKVASIALLQKYDVDDIVVLIASTNYYEQIIDALKKIGVSNYFVLLIMEANRRLQPDCGSNEVKTVTREDYVLSCCREEIQWNKVIFYSFGSYSDHGKYITEALLELRKDLDLVWLVKDMTMEVPEGVRKVYFSNWKRYIYEMETARIWVFNMVVPSYIIKRPGQIYIQTKHWAGVTLKKFYLDSITIQDAQDKVSNWRYNSEIIDYIITGSNFDTESSRRGFGFEKEVWQIGSPRSDALFRRDECKRKVYEKYQIRSDIRTLVYAPTYRFEQSGTQYLHESREIDLDYERVIRALENRFGGTWNILIRLHPSVASEGRKIQKPDCVIDAGSYADSEELVSACDVLISDYSSIMFEPAFVRKPVFLFATDKSDYIDKEYDLLIEYDTLPFPAAETNDELFQKIEQFDQEEYEQKVADFLERYGVHEDGHASGRAAVLVSKLLTDEGK